MLLSFYASGSPAAKSQTTPVNTALPTLSGTPVEGATLREALKHNTVQKAVMVDPSARVCFVCIVQTRAARGWFAGPGHFSDAGRRGTCGRSTASRECSRPERLARAASLVHLANIAARTGKVLDFDPKAEAITNDPEANALLRRKYRDHWGTPKGV